MPAQSLDQLLDFETAWDTVLEGVLSGLPFPVNPVHGADTLATPCIEAAFVFGGDHPMPGAGQPNMRGVDETHPKAPVSFKGTVVVKIIVDRKWINDATNETVNRQKLTLARGGVRRLFLPSEQAFNETTNPWYGIASVEVGPCERTIDQDLDLDITTLTYELVWFIRPEAWPV